jgi:hypothetical protein
MIITAHIGVWNPTARPNPPTTIKNVATKPKKVAPFGNRMLAVFTGLGQRRTLLNPLINMRQPRITRSAASARIIKVQFSNADSHSVINDLNPPHYNQHQHSRQTAETSGTISNPCIIYWPQRA